MRTGGGGYTAIDASGRAHRGLCAAGARCHSCRAELAALRKYLDDLIAIADDMEGKTICVFADAAAWPVQSYIAKYRDEFEQFIGAGGSAEKEESAECPA